MSTIIPQTMTPPFHRTIGDFKEIEYIKDCIIAMAPLLVYDPQPAVKRSNCSWNVVFATYQYADPRQICAVLVQAKCDEKKNEWLSIVRMGGGHVTHVEALWDLLEKMQDHLTVRLMRRTIAWNF